MWLHFLLAGNAWASFAFLALHANITVYSVVLVFASISFLDQKFNFLDKKDKQKEPKQNLWQLLGYLSLFFAMAFLVFAINLYFEDFNFRFIECTYMFIMKTPELMPNLGLFWYFLTEMFDHFLIFFTIVFQVNAFIYAIPLTIRLKDDPIVNIFVQVGLLATLKSYPSVGETSLYVSMLPMLSYLFPLMRNILVYSCMLLASTVLAPVMFYLWLGSGGGNANFYFAITLVNAVGQIFLLVDVLYANLKREFIKKNGADIPKCKSGANALFALE
jgi:GPI-anchor transamidase subunit U